MRHSYCHVTGDSSGVLPTEGRQLPMWTNLVDRSLITLHPDSRYVVYMLPTGPTLTLSLLDSPVGRTLFWS